MNSSLISQSKIWREEADKLLDNSNIYHLLKDFGDVEFTGSYDYDLMLGADIDIYIYCDPDKSRGNAIKLLNTLIEQNYWNGYYFYDFFNHSSEKHIDFPKSYYIGVKKDYLKYRWKLDIWFGDKKTLNINSQWIKNGLNSAKRNSILEIKQARNENRIISQSLDIYKAVINDNVKHLNDFIDWQKTKYTMSD